MRKLATLALLLASHAFAQDAVDGDTKKSTVEQLKEMRRALEAQRQEIESLEKEAAQRDRDLRTMQRQLQEKLDRARAVAEADRPETSLVSLARSAAPTPEPAKAPEPTPTPAPGVPMAILKVTDTFNIRFGVNLQPQYEAIQDPNSKGYSQNFFLRRARFYVQGNLSPDLMVFFQTEDSRLGYAGTNGQKNINSGFEILDAFVQWNFLGAALAVQMGEYIVPTIRQIETRPATFLSLDINTWPIQQATALQGNLGRDYGIGFTGYTLADRLSYRVGVFDGNRLGASPRPPLLGSAAGSRNPPRIAGRIMYDFFDPEVNDVRTIRGYSYQGTFLGKKKVLALAFVGDGQGDYKGFGGDAFFDWPLGPGGVTAEVDYMHYDGNAFYANAIPEQQTLFANAGYYFNALKLQPFLRYETLDYDLPSNEPKEQSRFGGGLNYYVLGFNFKITAYYERIVPKIKPDTATTKDLNRFVMQWSGSF